MNKLLARIFGWASFTFLNLGMICILVHFVVPNYSPSHWENIGAIAFPILSVFTFVWGRKFRGLRRGGRGDIGGNGGGGGGGGCGGGE